VRAYALAPGFEAANDAMRAGTFRGLDRLTVPVTLAWPEYDRLVARPRELPANVRNVDLPGCGHLPTWDDPAAVAAVLLAATS
jgi:pimeloyl-ACP methyl ester carboxylesterase